MRGASSLVRVCWCWEIRRLCCSDGGFVSLFARLILGVRGSFSGGAVRTPVSEAQMMADYAVRTLGVPVANVVIEDRSRTTVENIVNSVALVRDSPAIKIASNTFHARRARQILGQQSPELAQRLVGVADYLPLEWVLLHAVLLAVEHYRARRARPAAAA